MTIALPSSPAPTPTHANSNTTLDTLLMSEDGSKGRVAATQHAAVLSPPGPPSLFLRLANLLVAAAVIVVVHMSERSWVFGHTRYSDEVLAANNLATPARFAWFFWIPVTIYMFVWSVSQVHPTSYDAAANTAHNPIGSMFLVYGVSVIAWQLLWNFGMVPVALIALVGATFSVLTIYSRIKHNLPRPIPKRFLFTLHIPFGMSTAWTLSSLFFTVFSLGLATKNAQLVEPTAALGSILLGFAHIALAIYGRDPVPAAVAIFSQVTLHVAHTGNAVMMPVTATMIGMAVVTFVGMILLMTGVWAKVVVGREVGGQDEYEHV